MESEDGKHRLMKECAATAATTGIPADARVDARHDDMQRAQCGEGTGCAAGQKREARLGSKTTTLYCASPLFLLARGPALSPGLPAH
jgi:hypothetical protein